MITRCSQVSGAWPRDYFTVYLTATGGPDGCIGASTNSTTVKTNVKPTIVVTPVPTTPVCSDTSTKVVTFNLSGLDAGGIYNITHYTTDIVDCTAPGGTVTAGALRAQCHIPGMPMNMKHGQLTRLRLVQNKSEWRAQP